MGEIKIEDEEIYVAKILLSDILSEEMLKNITFRLAGALGDKRIDDLKKLLKAALENNQVMQPKEIGKLINIPPGSVSANISLARRKLVNEIQVVFTRGIPSVRKRTVPKELFADPFIINFMNSEEFMKPIKGQLDQLSAKKEYVFEYIKDIINSNLARTELMTFVIIGKIRINEKEIFMAELLLSDILSEPMQRDITNMLKDKLGDLRFYHLNKLLKKTFDQGMVLDTYQAADVLLKAHRSVNKPYARARKKLTDAGFDVVSKRKGFTKQERRFDVELFKEPFILKVMDSEEFKNLLEDKEKKKKEDRENVKGKTAGKIDELEKYRIQLYEKLSKLKEHSGEVYEKIRQLSEMKLSSRQLLAFIITGRVELYDEEIYVPKILLSDILTREQVEDVTLKFAAGLEEEDFEQMKALLERTLNKGMMPESKEIKGIMLKMYLTRANKKLDKAGYPVASGKGRQSHYKRIVPGELYRDPYIIKIMESREFAEKLDELRAEQAAGKAGADPLKITGRQLNVLKAQRDEVYSILEKMLDSGIKGKVLMAFLAMGEIKIGNEEVYVAKLLLSDILSDEMLKELIVRFAGLMTKEYEDDLKKLLEATIYNEVVIPPKEVGDVIDLASHTASTNLNKARKLLRSIGYSVISRVGYPAKLVNRAVPKQLFENPFIIGFMGSSEFEEAVKVRRRVEDSMQAEKTVTRAMADGLAQTSRQLNVLKAKREDVYSAIQTILDSGIKGRILVAFLSMGEIRIGDEEIYVAKLLLSDILSDEMIRDLTLRIAGVLDKASMYDLAKLLRATLKNGLVMKPEDMSREIDVTAGTAYTYVSTARSKLQGKIQVVSRQGSGTLDKRTVPQDLFKDPFILKIVESENMIGKTSEEKEPPVSQKDSLDSTDETPWHQKIFDMLKNRIETEPLQEDLFKFLITGSVAVYNQEVYVIKILLSDLFSKEEIRQLSDMIKDRLDKEHLNELKSLIIRTISEGMVLESIGPAEQEEEESKVKSFILRARAKLSEIGSRLTSKKDKEPDKNRIIDPDEFKSLYLLHYLFKEESSQEGKDIKDDENRQTSDAAADIDDWFERLHADRYEIYSLLNKLIDSGIDGRGLTLFLALGQLKMDSGRYEFYPVKMMLSGILDESMINGLMIHLVSVLGKKNFSDFVKILIRTAIEKTILDFNRASEALGGTDIIKPASIQNQLSKARRNLREKGFMAISRWGKDLENERSMEPSMFDDPFILKFLESDKFLNNPVVKDVFSQDKTAKKEKTPVKKQPKPKKTGKPRSSKKLEPISKEDSDKIFKMIKSVVESGGVVRDTHLILILMSESVQIEERNIKLAEALISFTDEQMEGFLTSWTKNIGDMYLEDLKALIKSLKKEKLMITQRVLSDKFNMSYPNMGTIKRTAVKKLKLHLPLVEKEIRTRKTKTKPETDDGLEVGLVDTDSLDDGKPVDKKIEMIIKDLDKPDEDDAKSDLKEEKDTSEGDHQYAYKHDEVRAYLKMMYSHKSWKDYIEEGLDTALWLKRDKYVEYTSAVKELEDVKKKFGIRMWIYPTARTARILKLEEKIKELEPNLKEYEAAVNEIWKANLRLVPHVLKSYFKTSYLRPYYKRHLLELYQESSITLRNAVLKYDTKYISRDVVVQFATYAAWWIIQGATRAIPDYLNTIRVPVHAWDKYQQYFKSKALIEKIKELLEKDQSVPDELLKPLLIYHKDKKQAIKKIKKLRRDKDFSQAEELFDELLIKDEKLLLAEDSINVDDLERFISSEDDKDGTLGSMLVDETSADYHDSMEMRPAVIDFGNELFYLLKNLIMNYTDKEKDNRFLLSFMARGELKGIKGYLMRGMMFLENAELEQTDKIDQLMFLAEKIRGRSFRVKLETIMNETSKRTGPVTLEYLGQKFSITRERIRQITHRKTHNPTLVNVLKRINIMLKRISESEVRVSEYIMSDKEKEDIVSKYDGKRIFVLKKLIGSAVIDNYLLNSIMTAGKGEHTGYLADLIHELDKKTYELFLKYTEKKRGNKFRELLEKLIDEDRKLLEIYEAELRSEYEIEDNEEEEIDEEEKDKNKRFKPFAQRPVLSPKQLTEIIGRTRKSHQITSSYIEDLLTSYKKGDYEDQDLMINAWEIQSPGNVKDTLKSEISASDEYELMKDNSDEIYKSIAEILSAGLTSRRPILFFRIKYF
ncbi:hypothetical protein ACFLTD_03505 [Elusimicrobiota bacterium]